MMPCQLRGRKYLYVPDQRRTSLQSWRPTDLVFLGKPLAPVVAAIDFSRKARHLMLQNIWLAVGYNLLAVPIAISGIVTPLIAALAMSGSSLLVMLNAFRARHVGQGSP